MARRSSDIIVGLDIGTTKIAAVVGEIGESGLDVIGIGTQPSRGLKKGVIVNIDSTVTAIVSVAPISAGTYVRILPSCGTTQPPETGAWSPSIIQIS